MPSKTPKQARLMAAIAHGWKPTNMKNPPPLKVAREFNKADTGTGALSRAMKKADGGRVLDVPEVTGLYAYGMEGQPGEFQYYDQVIPQTTEYVPPVVEKVEPQTWEKAVLDLRRKNRIARRRKGETYSPVTSQPITDVTTPGSENTFTDISGNRYQSGGVVNPEDDYYTYGSETNPGEQQFYQPVTQQSSYTPPMRQALVSQGPGNLEKGYLVAGMHKARMNEILNPGGEAGSSSGPLEYLRLGQELKNRKDAADLALLQQDSGVRQKSDFQNDVERLLKRTDPGSTWGSDARFARQLPANYTAAMPAPSESSLSPLARLSTYQMQEGGQVINPEEFRELSRYGSGSQPGERSFFNSVYSPGQTVSSYTPPVNTEPMTKEQRFFQYVKDSARNNGIEGGSLKRILGELTARVRRGESPDTLEFRGDTTSRLPEASPTVPSFVSSGTTPARTNNVSGRLSGLLAGGNSTPSEGNLASLVTRLRELHGR